MFKVIFTIHQPCVCNCLVVCDLVKLFCATLAPVVCVPCMLRGQDVRRDERSQPAITPAHRHKISALHTTMSPIERRGLGFTRFPRHLKIANTSCGKKKSKNSIFFE